MTNKNPDDALHVTFEKIDPALPYYLRGQYTLAQLKRQSKNRENPLPFFRSAQTFSPASWTVANRVSWITRRYAPLPPSVFSDIAVALRAVASPERPTTPTRQASRARRKVRK